MKLIFILFVVIVGVFAAEENDEFLVPGEVTFEDLFSENNRIASGVKAKAKENMDYCYLNVKFIQKSQVCGCAIIDEQWLLTSGRCVYE